MKNKNYSQKIQQAIQFLNNHPALNTESKDFTSDLPIIINDVCKNGYYCFLNQDPKDITVTVWRMDEPNFDKLIKKYPNSILFNKIKELQEFETVEIPYEDYYGYPWKYKKTIYECEYCFYMYKGKNITQQYYNEKYWESYSCNDISADSWNQLILKIEKDVKKKLGDFSIYDNSQNLSSIPLAIINKDWIKWFKKTSFYKKMS